MPGLEIDIKPGSLHYAGGTRAARVEEKAARFGRDDRFTRGLT
jgi:hypothetical protein